MVNYLNAGVLFIIESPIEAIAKYQNIHTLTLKVFEVIQLKVLCSTWAIEHHEQDG